MTTPRPPLGAPVPPKGYRIIKGLAQVGDLHLDGGRWEPCFAFSSPCLGDALARKARPRPKPRRRKS